VRSSEDIVRMRQAVREQAIRLGFSLVDQTKIVTAASELARNVVVYGQGGVMRSEVVVDGRRQGLRLAFVDEGPGIGDLKLALTDGWTSGKGLGLGLSGAKRLMHDFEIETAPGQGTRVTITRWK
jgi:serine/threonine-protein kinase RsbT